MRIEDKLFVSLHCQLLVIQILGKSRVASWKVVMSGSDARHWLDPFTSGGKSALIIVNEPILRKDILVKLWELCT